MILDTIKKAINTVKQNTPVLPTQQTAKVNNPSVSTSPMPSTVTTVKSSSITG